MRSRSTFTVRAAAWILTALGVTAGIGCELVTGINGLSADGSGGMTTVACTSPEQCDDHNPCTQDTCGPQGTCVFTSRDGTPTEAQTAGDCKTVHCENGKATDEPDDADVHDDHEDCTIDSCNAGVPSNVAKPDNTHCTVGGNSGICANGVCTIRCTDSSACPPMDACTTPTCDGTTGTCVYPALPDGMPTPGVQQVPGDCQVHVCMGGADTALEDDSDVPATPTDCDDELCSGGLPTNPPHAKDSPCSTFNGGSPGFCDGLGACVECTKDNECLGSTDDCQHPSCTNSKCGTFFQPDGHAVSTQTPGDCHTIVCDGAGGTHTVVDDTDAPNDGNVCTNDICTNGTASHTPNPGAKCGGTVANPILCNAQGQCGCMSDADCTAPNTCGGGGTAQVCGCTKTTCAAQNATCGTIPDACVSTLNCNDSAKDGNETDVDCGGSTNRCATRCAQGKKCNATSDCQAGLTCADGVCCNSACSGICQACTAAKKGGGQDGVCGSIAAGSDPDSECSASPATSCGTSGACNGAGACALWPSGTVCLAAKCQGSTTLQNAGTCNGLGTCSMPTTQSCSPYMCQGGACTTSCSVDNDCVTGDYCNAASQCVPKLTNGAAGCASNKQCASGVCAGGVCCSGNCSDQGGTSCGTTGTCAVGTGACQYYGTTQTCSSTTCANATLTTYNLCDGMGSCKGGVMSSACPGNFACNNGTSCSTFCFFDSMCATGFTCNISTGTCK